MSPEPRIREMPYYHRTIMFWALAVFFVLILPVVILYTSGYRIVQTEDGERMITTTGGFYTAVFTENIDLIIDDEVPQDRRPFSSAFYVQGFDPGIYEVRTQGEGLVTWVKDVPIYSHIVTQTYAFNVPETPVIRLITAWNNQQGDAIIPSTTSTSSTPLAFATTTNIVVQSSLAQATSTLLANPEYALFRNLFASTTQERASLQLMNETAQQDFNFSSEFNQLVSASTSATTTVLSGGMQLYRVGEEVYARWLGSQSDRPHYFCVDFESSASTAAQYGTHVYESLVATHASSTGVLDETFAGQTLCRDQIRIDRKWQTVQWFDFMPGSSDLVIMQLADGIYVVEIDDRAWQNVQLLYPGTELVALIDAGRIIVQDKDVFAEVFTEIPQ